MEEILKSHIVFSCGCKEWVIQHDDEKGVKEQPDDTVIDHTCEKITVYRQFKGLKRYFKRN